MANSRREPTVLRAPRLPTPPIVNGLTLLALIALAIGLYVAYRIGVMAGRRAQRSAAPAFPSSTAPALSPEAAPNGPARASRNPPQAAVPREPLAVSPARATDADSQQDAASSGTSVAATTPGVGAPASDAAELVQLRAFAEDRRTLLAALADARADVARYRQIVVDIENNAPPPLLASPGAPDDLKLIVGVGPVLERMLQQLGVSTYRQIARWTERDIDAFDARLPEFHGRVRRDDWVTQARELHQSKYGERP
jgi:predicted flap endonuclease-1-like 5' DNA nuclease